MTERQPLVTRQKSESDEEMRPLLSICVPTYNRAAWLRASLAYSVPQVKQAGSLVEIIVSDNASTDDTAEVVTEAQTLGPIRYSRNETNIGANPNMLKCVMELARGEYIWVMGDDDFLLPGAVDAAVAALTEHPVPVVFLNHRNLTVQEKPEGPMAQEKLLRGRLMSEDVESRFVPHVRDLIRIGQTRFTPLYTLIFQRDHAKAAHALGADQAMWSSLESVIPHALYMVEVLADQPSYYIGPPLIVASSDVHWTKYLPLYQMVFLPELYERMERNGADGDEVQRQRLRTLECLHDDDSVLRMFLCKDSEIRRHFRLIQFVQRYSRSGAERRVLASCFGNVLSKRIHGFLWDFRPTRFVLHRLYVLRQLRNQRVASPL